MFVVLGPASVELSLPGLQPLPTVQGGPSAGAFRLIDAVPPEYVLGGSGAGSAFALGRLGAPVALCTALGRDEPARRVRAWIGEAGIDPGAVVERAGERTAFTVTVYDGAGYRLAGHYPGALRTFGFDDFPAGLLDRCWMLLCTGYSLLPGWRPDGVRRVLAEARSAHVLTALELGPSADPPVTLDELVPVLPHLDYLLCDPPALAVLSGRADAEEGIAALLAAGAWCVVVQQGRDATLLRQAPDERTIRIPSFLGEAPFVPAAADAFDAALLFALPRRPEPDRGRTVRQRRRARGDERGACWTRRRCRPSSACSGAPDGAAFAPALRTVTNSS